MSDPLHKGSPTATGQMARVVEIPWTCKQTGDCCREPHHMVLTVEERNLLEDKQIFARRPLVFHRHPTDDRFRVMELHPCPFLSDQNLCLVYEFRPYNCRRFMCGRVDVTKESYEVDQAGNCLNLTDRIGTSQRFAAFYSSAERRAQKSWAQFHGWKRDTRT